MAHIHVNDVGLAFRAAAVDQDDKVIPVNTGDDLKILFQKPDESTVVKDGIVYFGPSGLFQYVTVSGDLDQSGTWRVQGYVAHSGGQWYGDEIKFRVLPNIRQVN